MVDEIKMVVAVRRDLDLGKGKIAAQVAHAAVSCALKAEKYEKKLFTAWIRGGQKKIVIRVDNEATLIDLKRKVESLGIVNELISDAGFTQIMPGTVTCLGIGPVEEHVIEPITGEYPLL